MKMTKQTSNASTEGGLPASQMLMNTEKLMMSLARLNGLALQSMLRMNVEAMSFIKHRYEQDVKILETLARCEGINEAMNTYSQFMKDTVTEYSDEVSNIVDIGSKAGTETAKRIRKEATALSDEAFAASTMPLSAH
jgi:hypothetical protein